MRRSTMLKRAIWTKRAYSNVSRLRTCKLLEQRRWQQNRMLLSKIVRLQWLIVSRSGAAVHKLLKVRERFVLRDTRVDGPCSAQHRALGRALVESMAVDIHGSRCALKARQGRTNKFGTSICLFGGRPTTCYFERNRRNLNFHVKAVGLAL